LILFDLLWQEGEELLEMSLAERRQRLESITLSDDIELAELILLKDEEELRRYLQRSKGHHVLKDSASNYIAGAESKSWIELV
jgi:ATP-dependent DNA ligase